MTSINSVNSASCVSNIQKTENPKGNEAAFVQSACKEDSCTFSKDDFSESLVRRYTSTNLFKGYYTMEGSINNKAVNLNMNTQKTGLFSSDVTYKGIVGDENVNLVKSGKTIQGKVGDKEVQLVYNTGFFGDFSIKGQIDGKEINITKNASVDDAQKENDILTLASSLEGIAFKIKDGKFVSYRPSLQRQKDDEEAAMMAMCSNSNNCGMI